MKAHVESELKYGLSRADYKKLLRAHRRQVIRRQQHTNFYLDDIHLNLRRKRIGLRIRLTGKKATLTLKYPKRSDSKLKALKVRREFESAVPYRAALKIVGGKVDVLSLRLGPIRQLKRIFPVRRLCQVRSLGSIETERTVLPLNKKFEMEVDRAVIFGQIFYEVEVETNRVAKADRLISNLFWKYGINYHPVRRSKLARFLEAWRSREFRASQ